MNGATQLYATRGLAQRRRPRLHRGHCLWALPLPRAVRLRFWPRSSIIACHRWPQSSAAKGYFHHDDFCWSACTHMSSLVACRCSDHLEADVRNLLSWSMLMGTEQRKEQSKQAKSLLQVKVLSD
jgi:hypothetical protein